MGPLRGLKSQSHHFCSLHGSATRPAHIPGQGSESPMGGAVTSLLEKLVAAIFGNDHAGVIRFSISKDEARL